MRPSGKREAPTQPLAAAEAQCASPPPLQQASLPTRSRGAGASAAGRPCRSHSPREYVGVSRGRCWPIRTRQSPVCRTCRRTCHLTCHCARRHKRCAHPSQDHCDESVVAAMLALLLALAPARVRVRPVVLPKVLAFLLAPAVAPALPLSQVLPSVLPAVRAALHPGGRAGRPGSRGVPAGAAAAQAPPWGSGLLVVLDAGRPHAARWALGSPRSASGPHPATPQRVPLRTTAWLHPRPTHLGTERAGGASSADAV